MSEEADLPLEEGPAGGQAGDSRGSLFQEGFSFRPQRHSGEREKTLMVIQELGVCFRRPQDLGGVGGTRGQGAAGLLRPEADVAFTLGLHMLTTLRIDLKKQSSGCCFNRCKALSFVLCDIDF